MTNTKIKQMETAPIRISFVRVGIRAMKGILRGLLGLGILDSIGSCLSLTINGKLDTLDSPGILLRIPINLARMGIVYCPPCPDRKQIDPGTNAESSLIVRQ